ncbi:MAG: zinc ribbon domain-containing protein [Anaerolineaceae bacterium]|nr:zinc ribbon domain-containing protein [Anaerolineaceae bacterium]
MKRTLFFLLFLFFFWPASLVQAQTAVTLESLAVELWPDYDQEAVLVLLTGTLPPGTPLPVTITVPLPAGADFNVAARITSDNTMTDQGVDPQVGEDAVTFALTEQRFRVEYYQPYTAADSQHSFTFTWQSDMAVDAVSVTIQQPIAATNLSVVPTPTTVSEGQDGLTYHVLAAQPVPAGETYSVQISYTMSSPPQLTESFQQSDDSQSDLPFLEAEPVTDAGFDWQLLLVVLGGLILVATGVWYFTSLRAAQARRPIKPRPQRAAQRPSPRTPIPKGKANFCHQCGQPLQPEDKFCRSCGAPVKDK